MHRSLTFHRCQSAKAGRKKVKPVVQEEPDNDVAISEPPETSDAEDVNEGEDEISADEDGLGNGEEKAVAFKRCEHLSYLYVIIVTNNMKC